MMSIRFLLFVPSPLSENSAEVSSSDKFSDRVDGSGSAAAAKKNGNAAKSKKKDIRLFRFDEPDPLKVLEKDWGKESTDPSKAVVIGSLSANNGMNPILANRPGKLGKKFNRNGNTNSGTDPLGGIDAQPMPRPPNSPVEEFGNNSSGDASLLATDGFNTGGGNNCGSIDDFYNDGADESGNTSSSNSQCQNNPLGTGNGDGAEGNFSLFNMAANDSPDLLCSSRVLDEGENALFSESWSKPGQDKEKGPFRLAVEKTDGRISKSGESDGAAHI